MRFDRIGPNMSRLRVSKNIENCEICLHTEENSNAVNAKRIHLKCEQTINHLDEREKSNNIVYKYILTLIHHLNYASNK